MRPVVSLGGEEDLLASARQHLAIVGFRLPVVVARRGVEVGDAQIERRFSQRRRIMIGRGRKLHADDAA
jgi:hypothetical protein